MQKVLASTCHAQHARFLESVKLKRSVWCIMQCKQVCHLRFAADEVPQPLQPGGSVADAWVLWPVGSGPAPSIPALNC